MNARERFRETMLFGKPDRIPYYALHYRYGTAKNWIDQGLLEMLSKEFRNYQLDEQSAFVEAEFHDELIRFFHIDKCANLGVGISPPNPAFDQVVLEETQEKKIRIDKNGVTVLTFKNESATGFESRCHVDFPVKTRDDFREMKKRFDPLDPLRYPQKWDQFVQRTNARANLLSSSYRNFHFVLSRDLGGLPAQRGLPKPARRALRSWTE